ncbi:MAG: hypothetical protein IKE94_15665 [Aeriscardovia sp.]|nr:hypothetical protein [Aeriscardovia sp.]
MSDLIDTIPLMKWQAEQKGYTCNDCYLSMQNCHDISICCEDETGLCDNFEEMPREDTVRRQDAIDAALTFLVEYCGAAFDEDMQKKMRERLDALPSVEQERLTDDDFETIRIHLNACKEKLCNQRRWKEADEYQRIIDRFMAFASAEPKAVPGIRRGYWEEYTRIVIPHPYNRYEQAWKCSECGYDEGFLAWKYCPNCGAKMEADYDSD